MSYEDNEPLPKLPSVPINLLKKRKRTNKDVFKAQKSRSEDLRQRTKRFQSVIKRPGHFINNARKVSKEEMRLDRYAKKAAPIFVSDKPKLGLVIRLHADKALPKACVQVFRLLQMDTYNQAVFIKVTKPMLELLSIIEPHIAWGYPNLHTVRDLITKRGRTSLGAKVHSITNQIVEKKLGKSGFLCIEDLIHELITIGPNLRSVLGFLHPFKILPPSTGWASGYKRCRASVDRLTGYREEGINEMIRRMN